MPSTHSYAPTGYMRALTHAYTHRLHANTHRHCDALVGMLDLALSCSKFISKRFLMLYNRFNFNILLNYKRTFPVFVRINARGVYFLSDCDPGAFIWKGRLFKGWRLLISIYVYEKTTM